MAANKGGTIPDVSSKSIWSVATNAARKWLYLMYKKSGFDAKKKAGN